MGLEVKFGFDPQAWAAVGPVDAGTAEVVRGGIAPLHDPGAILERLATAVR